MKRNELTDGQVIAYKTTRDTYPGYIRKATIMNPEVSGGSGYRKGGKTSVQISETYPNGTTETKWIQLWQVMGDYDTAKAELDLREAHRKIRSLEKDIKKRETEDSLKELRPIFTELGVSSYNIKQDYREAGIINIELSLEQFRLIANTLRRYNLIEARNQELRTELDELRNAQREVAVA